MVNITKATYSLTWQSLHSYSTVTRGITPPKVHEAGLATYKAIGKYAQLKNGL